MLDLRFKGFQSSIKVELYIIKNVYLTKDKSNEYWEQKWAQWQVGRICLGASLCTLKKNKKEVDFKFSHKYEKGQKMEKIW